MEAQVPSLGWEGPLEEEIATHPSTLAWRIPWSGTGCSPWKSKESDMTVGLSLSLSCLFTKVGGDLKIILCSSVLDKPSKPPY